MIPGDPESPFVTSGIRIGTPGLTTRGMKEAEMTQVVALIDEALQSVGDAQKRRSVKQKVFELCTQFPLYKN